MAALRTALRAAPRAHFLRPSAITSRSYAVMDIHLEHPKPKPRPRPATDQAQIEDVQEAQEDLRTEVTDPNMNGAYPDPTLTSALPIKRAFRDPYADWWDPIERRNYGEPLHEDNDILGVFSTEEYTHFSLRRGWVLMGCFVAAVGTLAAVVGRLYPDRPSAPRTFPGGLEKELGGPGAVRARMREDEESVL